MKNLSPAASLCFIMVFIAAAANMLVGEAAAPPPVNCNVTELSSCFSVVSNSDPPSALCCTKVKEQQPCFCTYLQNPFFKPFLNSPGVQRVITVCGVTIPTNC